ncbi:hypothetical protein C3990_01872 [Escherichia coli]|nr:hypothetical protein C3990_01872 [Escherichia coli]
MKSGVQLNLRVRESQLTPRLRITVKEIGE